MLKKLLQDIQKRLDELEKTKPDSGTHSHALNDLSDVQVTNAITGQVLTFHEGVWINSTLPSGPIDPPPPTDLVELNPVTDLVLSGQQAVDLNYSNLAFTYRYVPIGNGQEERRFLFYQYPSLDLIEYRMNPVGLKNGDVHWTYDNVPFLEETRRWKGWTTRDRMINEGYPNAAGIFQGNGAWPASFHFDQENNRLWYSWQPQYPGGAIIWAVYSAVTLADSEAGEFVSDANIHGPYYFRNAAEHDDFKQAACGFVPVPESLQPHIKGKYLNMGFHCANIGSKGPRGLGFWSVSDLPSVLPPNGSTLWPAGASTLLYDTSPAGGAQPVCNMKLPNCQFQACGHASQGTVVAFSSAGGSPVQLNTPLSTGNTVNDAIYQHDYGMIDCITVFMDTPAVGGTWVPEIWNGTGWVEPTGWAGPANLDGFENVFYWPQVFMPDTSPMKRMKFDWPRREVDQFSLDSGVWVRVRRTSLGSVAGTIKAVVTTTSLATGNEYPDRPLGQGGSAMLGEEQYDDTHFAYSYEESMWGAALVETAKVRGFIAFGPIRLGGLWYGAAPAYMQPVGGGVAVKREYYAAVESFGNGGKSEGPQYPYLINFSVPELLELAAGTRDRNGNAFQPKSFTRMTDQFPGLIIYGGVNNPNSPYYGTSGFNLYGSGHSVCFDKKTNEVLVWMSSASVWTGKPILAFIKVRGE